MEAGDPPVHRKKDQESLAAPWGEAEPFFTKRPAGQPLQPEPDS